MRVKVEVRREHLDSGMRCRSECCPVALAVQEATGLESAYVNYVAAVVTYPEGTAVYGLPKVARAAIRDFDNRLKVEPFSFDLRE